MSVRTKVLGLVDVMMRVPPVMVIDEILKMDMGMQSWLYPDKDKASGALATPTEAPAVPSGQDPFTSIKELFSHMTTSAQSVLEQSIEKASEAAKTHGMLSSGFNSLMNELSKDQTLADVLSTTTVKFVLCVFAFLSAACIFMLWTRHLVMVYMFLTSLGLTFLSYWSNVSALALTERSPSMVEDLMSLNTTRLLDSGGVVMSLAPHLMAQWFMGMLFAYIHLGPRFEHVQRSMPIIFASPILLAMLPLPAKVVQHLPVVAVFTPIILTKITLMQSAMEASRTVYNGYQYAMNFVSNFGLSALIENEWQRLNVPNVLRVFWTIRLIQGGYALATTESDEPLDLMTATQKLLVDGCETMTAVLGMTGVISMFCHYIGRGFQWYLLTYDDEEKSLGTVSAVLFYILALQTGLTSLSPDKRFIRLCRNLCLLMTALLHFLHNIVSPILMSLSAARNPSRKRHVRALSVCAFLVVLSVSLLYHLWSQQSISTWLLAVTAFSVEVVVKVLVSLATYTLFLLDARRQFFWEKLDDYLYYVRAFGNSVEFCFGILLFINGAWILIFESAQNATGGGIRAIMMCIHAYFNIWCEARAGWSVFMKRRSAVHKISALPEATPAQLQAFDDVCAICYQEMYSAKITRCRHFFHGVCLRKWLYVQDRCPLCHEIMMYTDKADENAPEAEPAPAAQAEQPMRIYPRDDANNAAAQRRSPERAPVEASEQAPATSSSSAAATIGAEAVSAIVESAAAVGEARSLVSVASSSSATHRISASGSSDSSYMTASAQSPPPTATSAAAVATAAASNTTHMFRMSQDQQ
uniref:Protein TRC8 homolog n=1 Tax=Drosophila melanogaster TaxID=7227 RepID=TRC8_DROME|nr:TRC8 ring finger protein, isoform D [Drosophila melanogaster]Q7KRW1.1 RecName: Full=Protein TRC8 homolog [Drosophila melanogaster]AAS65223.1 TRC8 ring finger protein, isoform D [Drosophila melanogaster]|eukprot:NP_996303.1 TRC8 ring finger protein, isoform D [Drosophila melanogaster]